MENGKLYEDSSSTMTILLQNQKLPFSSELVKSHLVHNQSSKSSFQGSNSMVNVLNVGDMGVISSSFFQAFEKEENNDDVEDENYEVYLHKPGKKRRLTSEQVHFLESNFEVENKLEPERKVQLAKELGLQPRQVAIWFQNRRVRFKTKQLEKDYGSLKASYDMLKVDYDNLHQENNKLKEEVNSLKKRLVPREEEENNLVSKSLDDINSQHKSDVVDSESLQNNDGNQSSVLETNQSEFSQDEEDILSQNLLTVPFIPKVEDVGFYDEPHESCCSFQFPFEDQTFCFWSY